MAFVLGLLLCAHVLVVQALNEVQNVQYVTLDPTTTEIRVTLKEPLAQPPSGFRTLYPAARVVLDLPQTTASTARRLPEPGRGLLRGVQLLRYAGGTRLVFELAAPATYEAKLDGNSLLVRMRRTPPARDRVRHFGAATPASQNLEEVRFERGALGEGRVIVGPADARSDIEVRQEGRRLILSFLDRGVAREREQRLDVLDFATPVIAIETRSTGPDARVAIEAGGTYRYSARQSDNEFVLIVSPLLP
jgi:type IV pilus assembly protein PilQ